MYSQLMHVLTGNQSQYKSYRIVSRFRFTVFLILFSISVFIMGGLLLPSNSAASEPQEYITIEVKPGDTLWRIAIDHSNKGKDTRKLIHEIKTINSLSDSSIFPGQLIKIPVDSV